MCLLNFFKVILKKTKFQKRLLTKTNILMITILHIKQRKYIIDK